MDWLFPVLISTTHNPERPPRFDAKAMYFPSGDQRGDESLEAPSVICFAAPPAEGIIQIFEISRLLALSMAVSTKAMSAADGHMRMFHTSRSYYGSSGTTWPFLAPHWYGNKRDHTQAPK